MFRASALFADGETWLPRFRDLGDLTLDLFHHDGRVEDRWLDLDAAEFELLWRLAKAPRRCLPAVALGGWARERGNVELALMRLSTKLEAHRIGALVTCHAEGTLCFAPPGRSGSACG